MVSILSKYSLFACVCEPALINWFSTYEETYSTTALLPATVVFVLSLFNVVAIVGNSGISIVILAVLPLIDTPDVDPLTVILLIPIFSPAVMLPKSISPDVGWYVIPFNLIDLTKSGVTGIIGIDVIRA